MVWRCSDFNMFTISDPLTAAALLCKCELVDAGASWAASGAGPRLRQILHK